MTKKIKITLVNCEIPLNVPIKLVKRKGKDGIIRIGYVSLVKKPNL